MSDVIPVFRPMRFGSVDSLMDTLNSSWWGTGPKVASFEREFASSMGIDAARCLMLNSCTAALHLAVKMFPESQRFLVPALTFISTGLAPAYEGKIIDFVEVGDDLCIDQDDVLAKLHTTGDVVIAVHMGGHVAQLDKLYGVCGVVEDCAHALGSIDDTGEHVGTRGVGAFSFQSTKGLPIGDGGMLTLSREDQRARASALAWCGIGTDTWKRSSGEDYQWAYQIDEIGYKYRANDVMASLALDQWPAQTKVLEDRRAIAMRYLAEFAGLDWLRCPTVRKGTSPNWQEFIVRTQRRDALRDHLAERGVSSTVHYYPIHLYRPMQQAAGREQKLPFTEAVWQEILTIPCFAGMTDEEQERVIDAVRSFPA